MKLCGQGMAQARKVIPNQKPTSFIRMNFRVKLNTFYPLRGGYGGMGYRELIYIADNKDWTPVFALWVGVRPLDIHGSRVRATKKDDKRVRGLSLSYKQYFVDVLWRGVWKTFEEANGE